MKQEWVTDTRKVVRVGQDSLAINIRKDLAHAMGVAVGSLVEVKMKNTGRSIEAVKEDSDKATTSELRIVTP